MGTLRIRPDAAAGQEVRRADDEAPEMTTIVVTVGYAKEGGMEIVNVWDKWIALAEPVV